MEKFYSSFYDVTLVDRGADKSFKLIKEGTYGEYYRDFLLDIRNESIFIDIGANFGIYSLVAAKNKNIKKIYAIEPVEETFMFLNKNIMLNNFKNIEPLNVAISDRAGEQKIFFYPGHSGAATMLNGGNPIKKQRAEYPVTEKIFQQNYQYLNTKIKIKKNIDVHIKIDVEGFEQIVLLELLKTSFAKNIKSIFIELDNQYSDVQKIISILLKNNFEEVFNNIGLNRLTNENHYDAMYQRGKTSEQ